MTQQLEQFNALFSTRYGNLPSFDSGLNVLSAIKNTSYSDFISFLGRLNGIILGKKNTSSVTQSIEYSRVWSPDDNSYGYLSPHVDDKNYLLKRMYEAILKMKVTKDIALLIYLGIQAIHPFDEGNGRTGREAFYLLVNPSKELSNEEKTRSYFQRNIVKSPIEIYQSVNAELAKSLLEKPALNLFGNLFFLDLSSQHNRLFYDDIPINLGKLCFDILDENKKSPTSFRTIVLLRFFSEVNKLASLKAADPLNLEAVIESFSINDLKKIVEIHKQFKKKFVETLIDIIQNPTKYPLSGSSLKDSFFVK